LTDGEWTDVPLRGSWLLEAFEGPISNIQRFAAEEDATLVSDAADAIRTIALVEACYDSSARGATPILPRIDLATSCQCDYPMIALRYSQWQRT
jgi:predicted dehydrogenase